MIRAIPKNIKRSRLEQGFIQDDVCKGIGINLSTYNQIENGKAGLRPGTAKKICTFLNKPFDDLFEIDDAKKGV